MAMSRRWAVERVSAGQRILKGIRRELGNIYFLDPLETFCSDTEEVASNKGSYNYVIFLFIIFSQRDFVIFPLLEVHEKPPGSDEASSGSTPPNNGAVTPPSLSGGGRETRSGNCGSEDDDEEDGDMESQLRNTNGDILPGIRTQSARSPKSIYRRHNRINRDGCNTSDDDICR